MGATQAVASPAGNGGDALVKGLKQRRCVALAAGESHVDNYLSLWRTKV